MGQADKIYDSVISDILANGEWDKGESVRTKWADGTPAYSKSIITTQMKFDGTEVPILTKKKVAWKTAIKELLWIWQKKSNNVQELRDMGVNIWNEWEVTNKYQIINGEKWMGTIGAAYGYQMGKKVRGIVHAHPYHPYTDRFMYDQVDYLIYGLQDDPSSRRHITSLWNIDDLDEMSLNPCVWNTQWIVQKDFLHGVIGVRSNDMPLGNPFNVFQYYVLQRMLAQVCGYKVGSLTFNINNAHIYERHIDGIMEQLKQPEYEAPTLWVNPAIKNFYDFTVDDFKLINYQCGPNIPFEIAI